jgi:septal ring factor EnvC (AmiA/AmiB activator)
MRFAAVEDMTISDMEAEYARLARTVSVVQDRRNLLLATIEQRQARAMAAEKVMSLTAVERDALKAAIIEVEKN